MNAAFLQYLRLRRAFRHGRWRRPLLDEAAHLAMQTPRLSYLRLYSEIQHSLCGFDTTSLLALEKICSEQKNYANSAMHHRILALKIEHSIIDQSELDKLSVTPQLSRYPKLLCAIPTHKLTSAPQKKLKELAISLRNRSTSFEHWIKRKPLTASYCVVGNAPTEQGKFQQSVIDSCNMVFRFNQVHISAEHQQDYGSRTDGWVISPAYKINQQDTLTSDVFISGVAVFDKPSLYWQSLARHEQLKFHTFPQSVWYELVAKLNAPPSAGLLCIASLQKLRHSSSSLAVFGVNRGISSVVNHYGDKGKRSGRHNWNSESRLVDELLTPEEKIAS